MNTLDNEKLSTTKNINQKFTFPNIFNLTKNSKLNSTNNKLSQSITNCPSLKHMKNHYSLKQPHILHISKKLRNEINLVHMLNIEDKLSNIINTDLNLKKQKFKIDNNISLKKIRLGINKKKKKKKIMKIKKRMIITMEIKLKKKIMKIIFLKNGE